MKIKNIQISKDSELSQPIVILPYKREKKGPPILKTVRHLSKEPLAYHGPISGPMWKKLSKLNSKYPDTFDWSVYDRLYHRFGKNQPRGSVVFKSIFKIINHHSSCTQCHYAIELDTYGRGCIHNCTYCYAKAQLMQHGFWNRPMPFPIDLAEVRKIFYTIFETDKPSKWRNTLGKRIPLRIGCMSDSFMWMDLKYKVTLEMLKILKFYRYPYIIATRSDLAAHDDYIDAMDTRLASVQYSITGTHERLTRLIEPGAPSIKRRFAALKKLHEAGFWTAVRLNPLFPTYPDGYFTDKQNILERFGSYKNVPKFSLLEFDRFGEFMGHMQEAKVPLLISGFVRLSYAAIHAISKATGLDFKVFYRPEILKNNIDKHYSDPEIAYYYKIIHEHCQRAGIRFTTCYIGNGEKDYYQYQHLWVNKKDCCDAVGNVSAFKTTSQKIPWKERIRWAPCKKKAITSKEFSEKTAQRFRYVLEKYHPEKLQSAHLKKEPFIERSFNV